MLRPSHFLCLILASIGAAKILSYDENSRRLQIKCPEVDSVDGDLISVFLKQRAGNGDWDTLASWAYGEAAKSGMENRVEVKQPEGDGFVIDAVLNGVTCYDAVPFKCDITAENNAGRGTFLVTNEEYFNYTGEISEPVITRTPAKDCYKPGEKILLDCTANIATAENSIVWETRLPDEEFSNITWSTDNVKTPGEVQENATGCTLRSSYPLEYTVRGEDDGRVLQCRLQQSGHRSMVKLSVQCPDNDCLQDSPKKVEEKAVMPEKPSIKQKPSIGIAGQVKSEPAATVEDEEGASSMMLILLCGVPLSLAVLVSALAVFVRQWRKKHKPQPLMVMDTPTSSVYGYADRRLPDLPHLHKHFTDGKDNTTPKWVSSSNLQDNLSPNTSVYVSMTRIDCLRQEAATPEDSNTPWDSNTMGSPAYSDAVGTPMDSGNTPSGGLTGDSLEPDMRADRSESVYSNQEAIKAKARSESMALGASARSTQEKIAY